MFAADESPIMSDVEEEEEGNKVVAVSTAATIKPVAADGSRIMLHNGPWACSPTLTLPTAAAQASLSKCYENG